MQHVGKNVEDEIAAHEEGLAGKQQVPGAAGTRTVGVQADYQGDQGRRPDGRVKDVLHGNGGHGEVHADPAGAQPEVDTPAA